MSGAIVLAFDYGTRRIGVAVGDTVTGSARPLPAIANGSEPDWRALDRTLQDWRPQACVVGLPLDLDGHDQAITRHARAFSQTLTLRFKLPVHLVDERLSSRAADDELRQARASGQMARRVRSGDRDGQAARLILEQWLRDSASRTVRQERIVASEARPEATAHDEPRDTLATGPKAGTSEQTSSKD